MENRNSFSNPKDAFLSKGTSSEEMASHFFITIIDGCLKYKDKERPKTGPIKISILFYNSRLYNNKFKKIINGIGLCYIQKCIL